MVGSEAGGMNATLIPPHDAEAEAVVAGTVLTAPASIPDISAVCSQADFYRPAFGAIFSTAVETWAEGRTVDPLIVAREVIGVTDAAKVVAEVVRTPITADPITLAHRLSDLAARRRMMALGLELTNLAADTSRSVLDVRDDLAERIRSIELAADPRPLDRWWTARELLATEFPVPPYVIPHLLREGDRLLLVGAEGTGKSVLLKQLATSLASGRNPLSGAPIGPRRTLIFDCENPGHIARQQVEMMPMPDEAKDNVRLLSRTEGVDLRRRTARAELHKALEQHRPALVVAGPLYKMFSRATNETDEQAAMGIMQVLDELRGRFGFALVLEHHAPKGSTMARDLFPIGSSAWMRWPEFGWTLRRWDPVQDRADDEGPSLKVGTFRGDRSQVQRPTRLDRAGMANRWPWAAIYPTGTLHRDPTDPGPRERP